MSANKRIPMFGIFHEAWEMCCNTHNIDWSEQEEERIERGRTKDGIWWTECVASDGTEGTEDHRR